MLKLCELSKKILRAMGCDENIIAQIESGDITSIRCNKDYLEYVKTILDKENIAYTVENSSTPEKFCVHFLVDVEKYYF